MTRFFGESPQKIPRDKHFTMCENGGLNCIENGVIECYLADYDIRMENVS